MTLTREDIVEDTKVMGHEFICHHATHIEVANKARQELAQKIADELVMIYITAGKYADEPAKANLLLSRGLQTVIEVLRESEVK
jgi:hypothetical protein